MTSLWDDVIASSGRSGTLVDAMILLSRLPEFINEHINQAYRHPTLPKLNPSPKKHINPHQLVDMLGFSETLELL